MTHTAFLKREKIAQGTREEVAAALRSIAPPERSSDLLVFEDAVREIYAGNPVGYDHFTHEWPAAIRLHGRTLAFPDR